MEEMKLGSKIILKVVEDDKNECNGCFFYDLTSDVNVETCEKLKCSRSERKDGKDVRFIRVED